MIDRRQRDPQVGDLGRGAEAQAVLVQRGAGHALGQAVLTREGQVVDDVDDDEAEAQRDYGQVVALEAQRRDADQHAEHGGEHAGTDYAQEEDKYEHHAALFVVHARALEGQAHQRGGVGADGHEAAVAQRELTHEAQHEVQAGGQDDEIAALPDAGRRQ